MSLPNGDFKSEIMLQGGTGRVTVQSPADVHIENGIITAEIIWSSPNYDLMIVNGKSYTPTSIEGGAHFEIEIPGFDIPLEIQAETVAMSAPKMIDYTLTVSGKTILQNYSETAFEDVPLDLSSIVAEFENNSLTGSSIVISSEAVTEPVTPEKSPGIPPFAAMIIGVFLIAVIAFVIITIGKSKKK